MSAREISTIAMSTNVVGNRLCWVHSSYLFILPGAGFVYDRAAASSCVAPPAQNPLAQQIGWVSIDAAIAPSTGRRHWRQFHLRPRSLPIFPATLIPDSPACSEFFNPRFRQPIVHQVSGSGRVTTPAAACRSYPTEVPHRLLFPDSSPINAGQDFSVSSAPSPAFCPLSSPFRCDAFPTRVAFHPPLLPGMPGLPFLSRQAGSHRTHAGRRDPHHPDRFGSASSLLRS